MAGSRHPKLRLAAAGRPSAVNEKNDMKKKRKPSVKQTTPDLAPLLAHELSPPLLNGKSSHGKSNHGKSTQVSSGKSESQKTGGKHSRSSSSGKLAKSNGKPAQSNSLGDRAKDRRKQEKQVAAADPKSTAKKTPISPSLSGKKLKHWSQLETQVTFRDDWRGYVESLASRRNLGRWQAVWPKAAALPLRWAADLDPAATAAIQAWWKSLESNTPANPMKMSTADRLAQLVQTTWANDVESRIAIALPDLAAASGDDPSSDTQLRAAWEISHQALAVTWLLPHFADHMQAATCESLINLLLRVSRTTIDCQTYPLASAALNLELPLTLALQFPEVPEVRVRRDELGGQMTAHLGTLLDGNGLPLHRIAAVFPSLLAIWTRCWDLSAFMRCPVFTEQAQDHYHWAIRQGLRLLRSDGSWMLSDLPSDRNSADFVQAMLVANDDLDDWQAAAHCVPKLPEKSLAHKYIDSKESRLPDPADESEWAKVAVLRSKWKSKADKMAVDFGGRDLQIELENSRSWLKGTWVTDIRVDGHSVGLDSTWSEVCWHSDDEVTYLEIQNELDGEIGVVQRQILISRDYRFCLLSDSVVLHDAQTGNSHSIDHHWSLPLADGAKFQASKETHDGFLEQRKHRINIIPLTLPEWRVEFSRGSLSSEGDALRAHYSLPAARLCQAMLLDLDHKRSRQPLTWRHLTVGENQQAITVDKAIGFRAQLDRMQFLIYRSLAPVTSRTVLGQNYHCDFCIGQFTAGGTCDSIITINGTDQDE